jgi:hypothetical protein
MSIVRKEFFRRFYNHGDGKEYFAWLLFRRRSSSRKAYRAFVHLSKGKSDSLEYVDSFQGKNEREIKTKATRAVQEHVPGAAWIGKWHKY